jgi:hypothetical protein
MGELEKGLLLVWFKTRRLGIDLHRALSVSTTALGSSAVPSTVIVTVNCSMRVKKIR